MCRPAEQLHTKTYFLQMKGYLNTVKLMNKRTFLPVIIASLGIVALIGLAVFVTLHFNRDDTSSVTHQTETLIAELSPSQSTANNGFSFANGSYTGPEHDFIFVGDSRTVAMKEAVTEIFPDDKCRYIAREGEGYYWLANTGSTELETALAETPDATVIFNLGINDLEESASYLSFYQDFLLKYPQASFYIMSVNPIEQDKYDGVSTEDILSFNAALETAFSDHYLDCYNYLISEGYSTVDGLHYSKETSRLIHHYAAITLAA